MNNRKLIGSGEYIASEESGRKKPSIEIPESWKSAEKQNEVLKNHETMSEEPTNERLGDNRADLVDYQDADTQNDTQREISHIENILKRYPPEQRHIFNSEDGIECTVLGGGEVPPAIAVSVTEAKKVLKAKFGEAFSQVFDGLKVYYTTGEIDTAGWTYSGANVILMDIGKNSMTVGAAEQLLGPHMLKILEEGDWNRVVADRNGSDTVSGETTLVHEFGHMLQSKTGTKFPDTEKAPTKYGRSKEWEDYAESFLYYCYDKPLEGNRQSLIAQDITAVTRKDHQN